MKNYVINPISILLGILCFLVSLMGIIMGLRDFYGETGSSGLGIIIFALIFAGIVFVNHGVKKKKQ